MFSVLGLPDAEVLWDPHFLDQASAAAAMDELVGSLSLAPHVITVFGRAHATPRLVGWYGDPGAVYTYSGLTLTPSPWTPRLHELRARVSAAAGTLFNSALVNLYRDGRDGMGWHSDDEAELGPAPVIASLSLGAPRRFVLRHRRQARVGAEVSLGQGALLLMRGATQTHYRHALPKTTRPVGPRLNLTFRRIMAV